MIKKNLMILLAGLFTSFYLNQAGAVPSFARQTNMSCATCHTVFPELNAFGRNFKLNGYTLTGSKQISDTKLQLNQVLPVSAMLQAVAVHSKQETDGTPRSPSTTTNFPDELSLFLAGAITPQMGSFVQLTMEQGSGFELDNADIRFADHKDNITYGLTLNNSPTTQDLWNSSPVWGFPWTHGAEMNAPLVADALAQNVAGVGGYADWGNGVYTEMSAYRDTNAFDAPSGLLAGPVRIRGTAPYWRIAWNKEFGNHDNLMLGAYGMQTSLADEANYTGPTDDYNDIALDTQYEHFIASSKDMLSLHASYTNEKQDLALSSAGSPTMKSLRLDSTYHWGHHLAATLGYANNTGNSGAYDDTAYTGQFSYIPWQNTKFSFQYVSYSKLAGNSNVSDANTAMLQAWLLW